MNGGHKAPFHVFQGDQVERSRNIDHVFRIEPLTNSIEKICKTMGFLYCKIDPLHDPHMIG